jgi:DMATS type aromatic prenyltransferase
MQAGSSARDGTLREQGERRLASLLGAFGYGPARRREAASLFAEFAGPWGSAIPGDPARWPSDVTDDHTPFEFSVVLDDADPEVRFLIEVQGDTPSVEANWEASLAVTRRLADDHGMNLRRLSRVAELFEPAASSSRFAMWHGVCFTRAAATFKVYLNPYARGRDQARGCVEEALNRLGLRGSAAHFPGAGLDVEIPYFSLDLAPDASARVKVYFAHRAATVPRIEAAFATVPDCLVGDAGEFCRALTGIHGPFDRRPVLTCLSFVSGDPRPSEGTVHLPVRSYASSDATIRDRALRVLAPRAAVAYERALGAFADRPLSSRTGMQTYLSMRLRGRRVTVYLATESHRRAAEAQVGGAPTAAE